MILRDQKTNGRRRVTIVEERVDRWGWTEIRTWTEVCMLRSGER